MLRSDARRLDPELDRAGLFGRPCGEIILSKIELRVLSPKLEGLERLDYATKGSAGIDLLACIDEPITIKPQEVQVVPSGIAIHLNDPGLCAIIAPRSGLGIFSGIVLANLVGIIDSDYTGEIKIACWNRSQDAFVIEPMIRVCQMIVLPIVRPQFSVVEQFSAASERNTAGFGSTGLA